MIGYSVNLRKVIIKTHKGTFAVSPGFIKPESMLNVLFNCITNDDRKAIVFGYHREKQLEHKLKNLLNNTVLNEVL